MANNNEYENGTAEAVVNTHSKYLEVPEFSKKDVEKVVNDTLKKKGFATESEVSEIALEAVDEYVGTHSDNFGNFEEIIGIVDQTNDLINGNEAEAGQPLVANGEGGVEFGDLPKPSYELVADTTTNKLTLTCSAGYFPTYAKIVDSDMANSTLIFTSQHSIGGYEIQSPTSQGKDLFSIDEMTISGTTCRIVLIVDGDFDAGDMTISGIAYAQCEGLLAEL